MTRSAIRTGGREKLTFPTFGAQEVPHIVMDPQVLLQHVLPSKGLSTLITAVALHTWYDKG